MGSRQNRERAALLLDVKRQLSTAIRERNEARAEVERLIKGGIVEVAVSNQSVAEYMKHWEGRAERAEAACAEMRSVLGGLVTTTYPSEEHEFPVEFCPECGGREAEYRGPVVHDTDCKLATILTKPNPGQATIDELTRLRAIVEKNK
jgi:hypothetical protein